MVLLIRGGYVQYLKRQPITAANDILYSWQLLRELTPSNWNLFASGFVWNTPVHYVQFSCWSTVLTHRILSKSSFTFHIIWTSRTAFCIASKRNGSNTHILGYTRPHLTVWKKTVLQTLVIFYTNHHVQQWNKFLRAKIVYCEDWLSIHTVVYDFCWHRHCVKAFYYRNAIRKSILLSLCEPAFTCT